MPSKRSASGRAVAGEQEEDAVADLVGRAGLALPGPMHLVVEERQARRVQRQLALETVGFGKICFVEPFEGAL